MFSPVDIDDVVIGVHTILVPLLTAPLLPLVPTVLPRVRGRQQGLRLKSKDSFFIYLKISVVDPCLFDVDPDPDLRIHAAA
jgi:hypothetical protein